VTRSCKLLKAFFTTSKQFNEKEKVKRLIDANILLSLCTSPDIDVADNAVWLLFNIFSIYGSPPDKELHPDFEKMKMNGILMKMISIFKEIVNEDVKRMIGLIIIDIDRECSFGEEVINVIKWIRDNTSSSTDHIHLCNTLVHFRKLVFRLIFIL
jgi:hypothetical protein